MKAVKADRENLQETNVRSNGQKVLLPGGEVGHVLVAQLNIGLTADGATGNGCTCETTTTMWDRGRGAWFHYFLLGR